MREERKTYWHLAAARRVPTDYEVATSKLHYYIGRGFEVDVPLGDWYRRYQVHSTLVCDDGDRFADPRETTYAKYVALQQAKETHVDGLLRSIEDGDYDRELDPAWVAAPERHVPPPPGSPRWSACCPRCATSITGSRCWRHTSAKWRPAGGSRSPRPSRRRMKCAGVTGSATGWRVY